jgi:hypothetical protein
MGYRTNNWFEKYHPEEDMETLTGYAAYFELGADAMLEALKAEGEYVTNYPMKDDSRGVRTYKVVKGWKVFIPDEEEVE